MAPGRTSSRKDNHRTRSPLPPRPVKILPVALAILLVVGGLLLFAHAQTQPLFQNVDGEEARNTQSPRDDGGILTGALLTVAGITLLLWTLSPLPPARRVLPAGVFAAIGVLLLSAHFSIFTNGIAFPDQGVFSVRSAYLFHDTAATIPIATFTLAFITLIGILLAGFAALALLAPRTLTQSVLRPQTLDGHRIRLLVVTLFLLGAGSAFARQFIDFAFAAAVSLDTRAMAMAYLLMGALLALLLVCAAWRSTWLLWGRLEDRLLTRSRRKLDRTLRLETGICTMLLVFTAITLMGNPVWEPPAGTDPVFAMSSTGVSWIFLAVLGIYLTQRTLTRSYSRYMASTDPLPPRIGPDRLFAFGLFAVVAWTLGAFWSLPTGQSPLVALTLRMLPLVLVIPLFALRIGGSATATGSGEDRALLILCWTALSILTGLMLWGIGNSIDIRFNAFSGGLIDPEGGLLDGGAATTRLLGSLLIVAPVILFLHLLAHGQGRPHPVSLSLLAGTAAVFALHVLFTITPAMRYDPFTGQTVVLAATWSNSLATTTDITVIASLVALTLIMGLITATRLMNRSAEPVPYPLPTRDWLQAAAAKIRRPSGIRQKEQQARRASRPSGGQDERA